MLTSRWRSWSLKLMIFGLMVVGPLGVGAVGLAGCSSGGDTSVAPAEPTTVSAAPEAHPANAAEVATGLRKIDQIARQVAESAGTDKAKAASLDSQIEPTWKTIEDTVKQNDQNTYLAMEDNFAVLEQAADDGDAAAAAKGSAGVSSAVQAYLAKYSG
ncbi:MAG: hypothetical protein JO287_00150 [Pseudonocardiales bacterium]|nr:hypothetical protein [Pseudonocardiales bacterium]